MKISINKQICATFYLQLNSRVYDNVVCLSVGLSTWYSAIHHSGDALETAAWETRSPRINFNKLLHLPRDNSQSIL